MAKNSRGRSCPQPFIHFYIVNYFTYHLDSAGPHQDFCLANFVVKPASPNKLCMYVCR